MKGSPAERIKTLLDNKALGLRENVRDEIATLNRCGKRSFLNALPRMGKLNRKNVSAILKPRFDLSSSGERVSYGLIINRHIILLVCLINEMVLLLSVIDKENAIKSKDESATWDRWLERASFNLGAQTYRMMIWLMKGVLFFMRCLPQYKLGERTHLAWCLEKNRCMTEDEIDSFMARTKSQKFVAA